MKIADSVHMGGPGLHGQTAYKHSLLEGCRKHVPHISKILEAPGTLPTTSAISVSTHSWHAAYEPWKAEICHTDRCIRPNKQQNDTLQSIHHRCVAEVVDADNNSSEPFLRLIHGLPGSGKSELLRWSRSYFEKVWLWTLGRELVFIAPQNSMTANIDVCTVHGWRNIVWTDKRGKRIAPQRTDCSDSIPALCTKTGALRWIFLDEVEATGTEVTGQLEQNGRFHVPAKIPFKYKDKQIRPFGEVNVCYLGDFWQLRPTGQIALMSDPFAVPVQECAKAQTIMGMFWYSNLSFSMQRWQGNERLVHLSKTEHSGADMWYSNF